MGEAADDEFYRLYPDLAPPSRKFKPTQIKKAEPKMTKLTGLLVGSHYVPPAKIFLEHLRGGTPLTLVKEPENPYDDHAIKVLVRASEVPLSQHDEMRVKLPGMGFDWDEMLAEDQPVPLGHLGASGAKPLLKARLVDDSLVGTLEFWPQDEAFATEGACRLMFDGSGMTLVVWEAEA